MPEPGRPSRAVRPREDLARAVVAVLAQTRRDARLSRPGLAAKSGVSLNTIAKIEQVAVTDPGFSVVAAIAAALNLPLDVLVRKARDTLQARGPEPGNDRSETSESYT